MRLFSVPNLKLDLGFNFHSLRNMDAFKTSVAIGGVYICRAANQIGTRDAIVNITVKGSDYCCLLVYNLSISHVVVPEGSSNAVFIRLSTNLNNLQYVGENLSLAFVENRVRIQNQHS